MPKTDDKAIIVRGLAPDEIKQLKKRAIDEDTTMQGLVLAWIRANLSKGEKCPPKAQ